MSFSSMRRTALKGVLASALATSLPAIASDAVLRVSAIPDEAPQMARGAVGEWLIQTASP